MNSFIRPFFATAFITSLTVTASYVVFDCYNPIYERIDDYTVDCWKDSSNNLHLNIYCHDYLSTNLPDTIEIKLPLIAVFSFVNCTFSKTIILQNIIHSMNIVYSAIGFSNLGNTPNRLNFQNLSAPQLFFENWNISELPYDLFYDVLNIRSIQISETQIVRIPEDFFSDWAIGLRTIILYNNKLQKIARNDFARLDNLTLLNINRNEIEEIEPGALDNLAHLEGLVIAANRLHTLPSGIFKKLTSLNIISFNVYFANIKNPVKNLSLYQMENLPSGLFKGATKLNTIEIAGHDLRSLPMGLFDDNKNLAKLELYENGLEFLPEGIFRDLKSLWRIDLSNNRLTSLSPTIFIELHSLTYLHVLTNNLTYIDPQLFENLKAAKKIDLSNNQIAYFWYQDKKQSRIRRALMNQFTNISESHNFERIMFLNLSFNRFSEFHAGFIDALQYCNAVDLTNNNVSKINLTGLSSGLAEFNRYHVNNKAFKYITLYLGNNPLHCDCNLIDFILYLNGSSYQELRKYLMIMADEESNFGEGFMCSSPPELKTRDVRQINLEEFYCPFQTSTAGDACNETCNCREYPRKQVLYIDCSYKNLTRLPVIINNVHNWSIELNMSGNALQRTPSLDDSSLINVTHLDLSNNNITEVSRNVFSLNLQELKLHNNSISRLDPKVIQYLAHDNPLRKLTLHNNRWKCDCESHKMVYSSIRKKLQSYNFHEIFCYGSNRKLYEVAISELCEDNKVLIFSVSISIALFGIVVSSLTALYYRYQKQIKIWLYSRELCLWFMTDDELDKDRKYDAFISFAHKDEEFVEKEIVAKLEEGPRPYKLCLHYRDWLAGEWIPLQISRSVADSKRTVIILTPNFLESVWGLIEFRTAHIQALEEGRARLIIVLHEEIGNLDKLDSDLKDYLSMNTYIKWGDPWFWQKLKYALPHRSGNVRMKGDQDTVHYRVNSENSVSFAERIEVPSL